MCKYIYSLLIAFVCMQLVGKAQTCPSTLTATLEGLPDVLCTQEGIMRTDLEIKTNADPSLDVEVAWSFSSPTGVVVVEVYDQGYTLKGNNTTSRYASLLFRNPQYTQITITALVKCIGNGQTKTITKTLGMHKAPSIDKFDINDCVACAKAKNAQINLTYSAQTPVDLLVFAVKDNTQLLRTVALPVGNSLRYSFSDLPNGSYELQIRDRQTNCPSETKQFAVAVGNEYEQSIKGTYSDFMYGSDFVYSQFVGMDFFGNAYEVSSQGHPNGDNGYDSYLKKRNLKSEEQWSKYMGNFSQEGWYLGIDYFLLPQTGKNKYVGYYKKYDYYGTNIKSFDTNTGATIHGIYASNDSQQRAGSFGVKGDVLYYTENTILPNFQSKSLLYAKNIKSSKQKEIARVTLATPTTTSPYTTFEHVVVDDKRDNVFFTLFILGDATLTDGEGYSQTFTGRNKIVGCIKGGKISWTRLLFHLGMEHNGSYRSNMPATLDNYGNILLIGEGFADNGPLYFKKISKDNILLQDKTLHTQDIAYAYYHNNIIVDNAQNVSISHTLGFDWGYHGKVLKYDSNMNLLWEKSWESDAVLFSSMADGRLYINTVLWYGYGKLEPLFDLPKITLLPPANPQICQGKAGELKIKYQCLANPQTETYAVRIAKPNESYYVLPTYVIASTESEATLNFTIPSSLEQGTYNVQVITMNQFVNTEWLNNAITITPDLNTITSNDHILATKNGVEVAQICENETIQLSSRNYYAGAEYIWQLPKNIEVASGQISETFYQTLGEDNDNFVYYVSKDNTPFSVVFDNNALGWHSLKLTVRNKCGSFSNIQSLVVYSVRGPFEIKGPQAVCVTNGKTKYEILTTDANRPNTHWRQYNWEMYIVNGGVEQQIPFTSDINANQTSKNGGVLLDFKKIIDSYILMTTGTINWNQVLVRLKVQAHAPGCAGSVSLPEAGSFDVRLYNSPTPRLSSIPTSCKLKNDGILNISFAEYAGQNIQYWVYNDVDDSKPVYAGTTSEQQISNLPTGKYIVYATFGNIITGCTGCSALPENRDFGGSGKDFCYSATEITIENGTPRFEVGCTSLVGCDGSSTSATIKGSVSFPGHINPLYSGFQGFYYRIVNHLGHEIQVGVLDLQPTDDFTIQVKTKNGVWITPNEPYKLTIGAYSAVPNCDVCTMNNIYCPHEFDIVFQTPKVDIAFENSTWMNMRDTYFKCPNATTSIKVKVEAHAPLGECPTNLTVPHPYSYASLPLEYKVVLRDAYNKPIDATPNSGFRPANTLVNDISILSSGKYIIIVRPVAYTTCIFTKTFDVIELSPVTVTSASQNANCSDKDGKITLLAVGFNQHMEYVWEEAPLGSTSFSGMGYNTAELTNLKSGQYRYTIRYKDGAPGVSHCSEVARAIVTINKDEASITNVVINNGISQLACQNTVSDLPANITATNATRGKTFIIEWLKEQTISNTTQMVVIHTEEAMQPLAGNFVVFLPANLASEGKYVVNVKDPTGCPTKSTTITLTKPVSVARNFTICVRWETEKGPAKEDDAPVGVLGINPADAIFALQSQVASCLDQQRTKLEDLAKKCFDPEYLKDRVVVTYKQHMEHCTLYYYDRAGQLTKTIPPKGVDLINPTAGSTPEEQINNMRLRINSHTMATTYTYNSLGQLVKQNSPDGGTVHFVHDGLGRIRFSQDDRHKANNTYSYTKYDELGRSTEVGVRKRTADGANTPIFDGKIRPENDALANNQPNTQPFPQETGTAGIEYNTEETKTVYSAPADVHYLNDPSKPQRYLLNRVSYAYTENIASLSNQPNQQNKVYNYYSYDVHGNVEWLAIDVPGMERKFVSYKYDLISGKVHMVKYNEGKPDQFYHKYEYDADNRILAVYTSTNGMLWDKDAKYEYYQHGPLKRIELGENKVQGVDYIYTIQGWIKGINSPVANKKQNIDARAEGDTNNDSPKPTYEPEDIEGIADIGGDGKEGSEFAADQFGMAIGYYNGDYKSNDENGNASVFNVESNLLMPMHRQLFNGNISTWATHTNRKEATGNRYNYDRLHRITQSSFMKWSDNAWGYLKDQNGEDIRDAFKTTYKYDANGNIMHFDSRTSTCNGFLPAMTRYDNMGRQMDNLVYKYGSHSASNPTSSNRLAEVTDLVQEDNSPYKQDLEKTRQYDYDAIGNITKIRFGYYDTRTTDPRNPCGIFVRTHETSIEWTAYNKPSKVTNTKNGKVVRYLYDAMGNRVLKFTEEINDRSKRALTYHVRDAQGNVLSTYEAGKKKTVYTDRESNRFTYHFDASGVLTKVTQGGEDVTNDYFASVGIDGKYIGRILFDSGKVFLCVSDKNKPTPITHDGCVRYIELGETTTFDNTLRQTEVPIYGSDRIGMYTPRVDIDDQPEIVSEAEGVKYYSRARGAKRYELKDHLGNIRVTVSDRKIATIKDDKITYHAEVLTYTDYYPFGMAMPTRNYQSPEIGEHRYGFNGKENDADFGDGIQDYGFRIYDELVCRFLSVDPLTDGFPELTPYQFASNTPISSIDLDGLESHMVVDHGTRTITVIGVLFYRSRTTDPIGGLSPQDVRRLQNQLRREFRRAERTFDEVTGYRIQFDAIFLELGSGENVDLANNDPAMPAILLEYATLGAGQAGGTIWRRIQLSRIRATSHTLAHELFHAFIHTANQIHGGTARNWPAYQNLRRQHLIINPSNQAPGHLSSDGNAGTTRGKAGIFEYARIDPNTGQPTGGNGNINNKNAQDAVNINRDLLGNWEERNKPTVPYVDKNQIPLPQLPSIPNRRSEINSVQPREQQAGYREKDDL